MTALVVRLGCVKDADCRDLAFLGGTLNRGRRAIHARLDSPGRVGMCRFDRLTVEVSERGTGSDLWIHATRMVGQRWEPLTSAAATLLHAEVGAAVSEFGFHDAWLAGFTAGCGKVDVAGEEERCRWEADWWFQAGRVERQLRDGELSVLVARGECEGLSVDVAPYRAGDRSWEPAAAMLVDGSGVKVGWLSDAGRVVPCVRPRPR